MQEVSQNLWRFNIFPLTQLRQTAQLRWCGLYFLVHDKKSRWNAMFRFTEPMESFVSHRVRSSSARKFRIDKIITRSQCKSLSPPHCVQSAHSLHLFLDQYITLVSNGYNSYDISCVNCLPLTHWLKQWCRKMYSLKKSFRFLLW